ncbi:MAG: hypothetical protein AAFO95_00895, partial [Cyanobacteria bacterium J06600_6]
HRDAEKESRENRLKEINRAITEANINNITVVLFLSACWKHGYCLMKTLFAKQRVILSENAG